MMISGEMLEKWQRQLVAEVANYGAHASVTRAAMDGAVIATAFTDNKCTSHVVTPGITADECERNFAQVVARIKKDCDLMFLSVE